MEPRRLTGLLALIVLLVAIAVAVYFDYRPQGTVTASNAGATATEPAASGTPAAIPADGGAMSSQAKEPAAPGQPGPLAAAEPGKPAGIVPEGGMMSAAPTGDGGAMMSAEPADGSGSMMSAAPVDDGSAMMKAVPPADGTKPAAEPAATEVAKAEPSEAVVSPGPPAAMPAAPAAAPAESEAAPPAGMPSFDVVRVEPTGEAVIAGLVAAGDTVEVMDSGAPVAKAIANDRGEWALTLDAPLAPGTHDLAIRTTSGDKKSVTISDQRVAVSIADSKKENPLVVLSTPDGPSRVLDMPAAVAAAGPPAAAGAGDKPPATPPNGIALADAGVESALVSEAPMAAGKPAAGESGGPVALADAGAEKAVADEPAAVAAAEPPAGPADKPAASPPKEVTLADAGGESALASEASAAADKPAAGESGGPVALADAGAEKAVADEPSAVAAAEPPAGPADKPAASPPKEVALANAGAESALASEASAAADKPADGESGGPVALADAGAEEAVADKPAAVVAAEPETGAADKPAASPPKEVALANAGAESALASEASAAADKPVGGEAGRPVSLADAGAEKAVADHPPASEGVGLADVDAEAGVVPEAADGVDKAAAEPAAEVASAELAKAPEKPAEPPKPVAPVPMVAISAVEADTAGGLYIAGIARTPETVRVYIDDKLAGDARPNDGGTWLLELRREMPAGTYRVRADQVDGKGEVLVRAEVPFERDIEVAALKPVGEAGSGSEGASATGSMPAVETIIIKRTDNLWRISRRMYGKGIRWSTLYQANKDQIRNPRWIFPGQVFVVPTGDTSWKN